MQRLPIVILLLQHNIILFSCAFFFASFPSSYRSSWFPGCPQADVSRDIGFNLNLNYHIVFLITVSKY